jgi:hypothetical protein
MMQTTEQQFKPPCSLTTCDGNVFSIIGAVRKALKKAGQSSRADEFSGKAMMAGSYDEVLRLCFDYVDVE